MAAYVENGAKAMRVRRSFDVYEARFGEAPPADIWGSHPDNRNIEYYTANPMPHWAIESETDSDFEIHDFDAKNGWRRRAKVTRPAIAGDLGTVRC